ncbi:MAG: M28 family peptidase [Bryobacteraceae bacterium]
MNPLRFSTLVLVACLGAPGTHADCNSLQPQVQKIVGDVSEDHIRSTIARLVAFGTRNTLSSQDDPERGIGAARKWIFQEFQSYSPRLQVRYDHWRVKKQGQRIVKDIDLYNVIAVLPGKTNPEAQVVVSGHYDSLNLGTPAGRGAGTGNAGTANSGGAPAPAAVGERPVQSNWEKNIDLPAPGACDDASGAAAVMELARVMSRYEFEKTLVFIAFAGEEQGLVGSTLEAAKAKQENLGIEAVLNNDVIGTDVSGDGRTGNSAVAVYSDDVLDSPAQQLARYVHTIGQLYLPQMSVNIIYLQDRLGRGGDQSPFQQEGYPAVRLSTPNEILANQHRVTDTLENMSVPYTARVARVNAAAAASLALAPRTPDIMSQPRGGGSGAGANAAPANRRLPMISRGSGYDAVLRWRPAGSDATLKGYAIVLRATTSPFWEQEIYVGKVTEFTLKGLSIDETRFGVKAIGKDGSESLVAAYAYPPRPKVEYQTAQ